LTARVHGGPNALGAVRWDFSTNVNAAGPCPHAVDALASADATRYPDASYLALRIRLAEWHAVAPERILLAASASEFIQRITAVGARLAPGPVCVPTLAYGDYAVAAQACGRDVVAGASTKATLRWCAEPSSPLGQDAPPPIDLANMPTILDSAYAPLRLAGRSTWPRESLDSVFQLFSPNKALGLPGVRGAYAIAPVAGTAWPVGDWVEALAACQPSWPLGAHAVALLDAWVDERTQAWLAESLATLAEWTNSLRDELHALGLEPLPSVTPFLCARLPAGTSAATLRERDLAVRDSTSFGLPGWMRVSAQCPEALEALIAAIRPSRPRP
jgi:histidinol-phosphate aminotransferase